MELSAREINERFRLRVVVFTARKNKAFVSYVQTLLELSDSNETKIKWLKDYVAQCRIDAQVFEQSLPWEDEE